MTRPHSVESSEPSAIHPVLAKALNCVDVQLETELARYRREIAESGESRSDLVRSSDDEGDSATVPTSTAAPPPATELPQLNNPLNLKFASEGTLVHQPQTQPPGEIPTAEPPPNDYLESSEQLLRNLDTTRPEPEPEPPPSPSPSFPERLLTPLGVGSMALLFGAIALLGAAILDPERLTTLRLPGIGENRDTAETIAPTEPETESETTATNSDEELDLDNLSNIQPQLRPSPQAPVNSPNAPTPPPSAVPPNYNIPGSSSDLTNALVPPLTPAPEASPQPSPAAPPVPQNIEPAPAPTTSDYYYVLADYSGPNSLQQAQAVVPDAYVRQFEVGDRIQVGAFLTQADANALANRLQDQGLPVSVYRP